MESPISALFVWPLYIINKHQHHDPVRYISKENALTVSYCE